MSWALEEWKEGLPTRALQKIQELEGQLDKLKRERQQRQFQLDALEAALQKQKQKVENEKTEGTNLKRENQSLMEMCENLERARQKISHELQAKESQVNLQEGQLNASKKQIEKLEQELKRCKSELERSQQSAPATDASLNPGSTPQKILPTPLTPSQYYTGSRYEDLKEKYNKEVEERKRLEAEVRALQAKKASPAIPQSTMNHREIARHQASSSVFSWQQEKTPSRLSCSARKTPNRRDFPAPHFAGEQEVTPSRSAVQIGTKDASSSFCDNSSNFRLLDQLKAQNQELRSQISELELRLQGQERELKSQVNKCQELQLQLETAKVELIEKEKVLNKNRDELMRTAAQYDQASAKCIALEQKLKKLTEDLSCQRQNAESARCSLDQKMKEREKEFQQELSRQQQCFQTLDRECSQMKTKLTQELQQAKSTHNILQAELDKVTSVKQHLEKNLEEFKQKFCRTEEALEARESELRRSREESKKENSLLQSQSEQRAREICHLEEELRKAKQCLNQSQKFAEEMRVKNTSQETMLKDLQEKMKQQENSLTLEKLKLALADLEKQRDCSQDLLKKREHHIEQLNEKLSRREKESQALLTALELKEKEYEELKEERTLFTHWKSEKEQLLNQMEAEKETLQNKINHLETCLKTQQIKSQEYNERVKIMEIERENLSAEIRNLHSAIDSKKVEVEAQKQAYRELQQEAELSDQKHKKEIENMCLKTSQLTGQVGDLEHKLQLLSSEIAEKDQCYRDLHAEYESFRGLLKPKHSSPEIKEDHHRSLLACEEQPAVSNSFAKMIGEQGRMPLERSKCQSEADQSATDSADLQNRIISLELSLESQKQMNSDLQQRCEELVQIKGEIEENLIKAEQMHQSFVAETNQRINKLQEDTSVHQNVVAESLVALENKERELQLLSEKLETQQGEYQELEKSNGLLEGSLKELQLLSETLSSEKKEMSSILSLSKQQIEELTQENGVLKEVNAALNQEKMNLLQKSEHFSNCIDEREKHISELSDQYKQEKLTLLQRCEETENAFEDLRENYEAVQEKNSRLECLLNERTSLCENRKNELEQLKETFAREHQELLVKLASAEERNQSLVLEVGTVQHEMRSEITDFQNNAKSEADGLRQEIMTLKEDQSRMQKDINALLEENESLMKLTKTSPGHQDLELGPTSYAVKEREREINECNIERQMDLDVEATSLDSYNAQLVQLEAVIRSTEFKLQASEKEKAYLQEELHRIRGELENGNLQQGTQSREVSGLTDCEVDAEEKSISVLHELSTSQNDSVHLQCSLETAMTKLNELEKMCQILQVEKPEPPAELSDSGSECVTATSKMAEEVEKLANEVKILNHENGLPQGELVKQMPEDEFGEQQNVFLNPLEDSNFCEHLTLSNKEVQTHFAELQEKFSSLQSEHKILHDQHCRMSSKMSELQFYVDTLKAENSVLSMNLRNFQDDLVKEVTLGPEEGRLLSLSFSCVTDSPVLKSFGESSFCKDLLEQTGETSLLNNLEENVSVNQSNVAEMSCSSLEEESQAKKEVPSAPGRSPEDLEALCQMYLQALRKLEEEMEGQGVMKNKEIQELQQLLSSERKELECLRKQYLSENEQWQRKLTSVTVELESKLAAEKKQTAHLSLELEAARLQLQGLDLSSRPSLGADIEDGIRGGNERCDIKESEEYTPKAKGRTPKRDIRQIGEKDVQQDLSLEIEKLTEIGAVIQTGRPSGAPSSEASSETPLEGKDQGWSECISELSFSDPNALVPMDFLETQVTIQNLQLQVKETSNENLKLLHVIEDRDKKLESLLNEVKELSSKIDLQKVQLTTKTEACIELEKTVEELKKEKSDLSEKLEFFSCDNSEIHQKVKTLEDLSSNLEMTDKLTDEVIEDNVAMVNDNWKEKFLHVENKLERIRSEKVSMEHQILSVEANLETFQTEKLNLEKDNENKQKVINCLEEELSVVTTERNQLHGELSTVSRENKELSQMSDRMQKELQELENHHDECLHHIQIVEAEVKEKTVLLQTLSSEKADLQEQLQSLEKDSRALSLVKGELENQIGQLSKERDLLVRDLESLQNKLSESEDEKAGHCKALEAALVEKSEIAVRLSSTQEEVLQLRTGIEKLKVRIEADEKRQLHVLEKLKESERRSDSLKDKVENLERELQMSEENQELVILDAENSKAEVETLKEKIEEMAEMLKGLEFNLVTVRSEKENLTEQLQEKQSQALEVESLLSSLKSLIEEKEQEKIQMKEESKTAVELLQIQLKELNTEIAALCDDQETSMAKEESLGSPAEEVCQLGNSIEKLKVRITADEKKQLHVLEKLQESEQSVDLLKGRIENLERELEVAGKNQELVVLDAENSKAEVETLKTKIEEMAEILRGLEFDLVTVRSEKENLTEQLQEKQSQVLELEPLLSSLKTLIKEKEQEKIQMKEECKAAGELLQAQLKELNEEVAALCDDQETSMAKEVSLGSPAEEVQQLRNSIEKLKVCIAADKKKQLYVLEKLQESEQSADLLKGRVVNLERKLEVAGKNQELVILDAENSKAEIETLKIKMEELAQNLRDLELDLANIRSEKESLTRELQTEQGRVSELEMLNSSFENLLQEKEQEKVQMKEESKIAVELLQTQLKELNEKVAAMCVDQETFKAKEQSLSSQVDSLEHEKAQLLQGLEEARNDYISLQSSVDGLVQEIEDGRQELEKKREEISTLKNQIQDQEQLTCKLSQVEGEQQLWEKQKTELGNLTVELEQQVQALRSRNASLQNSYKDLEKELESIKMEKMSFVEKVNTMTVKDTELQRKMHEMVQKTAASKEEFDREKDRLVEELKLASEEIKSSQVQLKELKLENGELKKSLDCARTDQMEKEGKVREEIVEYQLRLQETEKQKSLLLDTNKQYEMEIQTYREKLTSKEECLGSQKLEMDLLKSGKEELNNSLKATNQILEELKKTKMDNLKHINQLKKANEHAQGKMKLLIKSCKQLEGEKEMLQKELAQLEAAGAEQKTGTVADASVDELMAEVKELKETLEEKTKEADEYLDKYCSLLISHENLEKAKEMLEMQVARLSQPSKCNLQISPLPNSLVPEPSPAPSVTERKLSAGHTKASGKRQRSSGIRESGGGSAPSTLETFPKKGRKAARSGVHSAGDTEDAEFEPEGLPEVVQRGFADIPTGKTSPYVLRRTTMATRTSPRLAAQKLAPSPLSLHKENLAEISKPTAGGSRSQKVKVAHRSPADSGASIREASVRSVSSSNLPGKRSAGSPREGLRAKRSQHAPSPGAGPDLKSGENCRVQ
ncbi:centromere protein F isoform X1 [Elephas maximus indicus]|uniref:centromere protein F isoform X1 n=2 Tax=Elephas maximus indicus TaxID=99487 RepID=UPI0021162FBA|nr:centromere protein F isoform X1 [Elephas maximus indicus]XP_049724514.1 centromere protein F isoform X1 [Elephas maximus indicus]XP_049724515.1 centromere protein F isoform X1 [Elephas maximus indicus]XP_049724516.1 centromere protein F isoform X1 [Elephas maximus indicus]XP_049724517.1 centromere protein F isoform X1 [Elephas maximus indicus]XP_049724518.1 centromere protein F isoform X1 [Elephas maximus indicus]XP_049724519.1 centromere protein F isoform X1 [Elephas maximus indicus]XP_0